MRDGIVWMKGYEKKELFKRGRYITPYRKLTKVEKDKAKKHLCVLRKIICGEKIEKSQKD